MCLLASSLFCDVSRFGFYPGGCDGCFPPLSLRITRRYRTSRPNSKPWFQVVEAFTDLIGQSMASNYPKYDVFINHPAPDNGDERLLVDKVVEGVVKMFGIPLPASRAHELGGAESDTILLLHPHIEIDEPQSLESNNYNN